MDPKLKKQWINALRSGKYKQCRGAMKEEGKFCALGVLRNVISHKLHKSYYSPKVGNKVRVEILPTQISTIINLNDDLMKDFVEIADYVSENIPDDK